MILDTGEKHESKIKYKNLSCPPLSGYNHLAVYIRWAYNKGLLTARLLEAEPRLEAAMRGELDLREVISTSKYMKGRISTKYYTKEGKAFSEQFYNFHCYNNYPGYVDKNAENYFGSRYKSSEFKNEAYLFVPYDEDYYINLSKFIEEAWNNRKSVDDRNTDDMSLIEEYVYNVEKMQMSLHDYGNKQKVIQHNKLVDRNAAIAESIDAQEKFKEQFVSLLNSDDRELRVWVAHHMIERMTYDKSTRQKALKVIEDDAINNPNGVMRLGNQMWLEEYYSANPDDRLTE